MPFRCTRCGAGAELDVRAPACPACGGLLAIPPYGPIDPALWKNGPSSLWRWSSAFPDAARRARPVTLGEGPVPLEPLALTGLAHGVFALRDDLQPTGSWKDRGAALLVSALVDAGCTDVVEDSSGNAGLALARYGAAAGLSVTIFAPESGSRVKKDLVREAGALLVEVAGSRDRATDAVLEAARGGRVYASHVAQPLHAIGAGTAAFCIFEALGRMPGAVVLPAGQGGLLTGVANGFAALERDGFGPRPRLIGVQSSVCAPLVRAFAAGADAAEAWADAQPGLCEGVICPRPARDRETLAAVRASGGALVEMDDLAVERALRIAWRDGLRIEPTSALPLAWLASDDGRRLADSVPDVVVILTGHGIRAGRPLAAL